MSMQGKYAVHKKIVGSPQNVSHLMTHSSEKPLASDLASDEEDKRLWFKKYRTRGNKRETTGSGLASNPQITRTGSRVGKISDKKSAQLQMALSCLSHPDIGAREHGLKVLVNIGLEPGCLPMMTEAIPSLVDLMNTQSSVNQMFATFVLANAALEPVNQAALRKANAISTALRFLRSNNPEILEKALWLLTNITREGQSRLTIVKEGGVPILLQLLSSSQMSVVIYTTQVFRNLFYEVETQLMFADLGGIDVLIRLQDHQKLSGVISVDELRLEWTHVICILSYSSPEIRSKLINAGAVDILCMLLSTEDEMVVSNVTQALTNLSSDPEAAHMIAKTASATSLIQQLISSSHPVQEHTALLLTNLGLVSNEVLECFPQYGGIESIFQLIKATNHTDPLLWKVIFLTATVCRDELCRRELLEMGIYLKKEFQEFQEMRMVEGKGGLKGTLPVIESIGKTKEENLKLASKMGLHNLKLSFVHLKAHKEVRASTGVQLVEGDDEKSVMHRARVVNEVVNTEKQYVENLLVIDKVFREPLEKNTKLLSRDERVKIFSIVDTLYALHSNFLAKLQKVVLQSNSSGYVALGDVFKAELVQQLKVYRLYINNYDESCDTLIEAKSRPAFETWLDEQTATFKSKKLDSLLITPIQRIPRYCLLLSELLKKMPPPHPDYENLTTVLQNIQDIANYLEEEKQKAFSHNEMIQMQKEITNLGIDFTEESWRRFIRKGTLLLDSETTDKDFYEKNPLNSKVQYLYLWLLTDKLIASRDEKKSHKQKLVGIYDLTKMTISKFIAEAEGIKREVLKIGTELGSFVVYLVEEEVLEDWYVDLNEEIQKRMQQQQAS